MFLQGGYYFFEIAVEDSIEFMQGQPDTVIGDTRLGKL